MDILYNIEERLQELDLGDKIDVIMDVIHSETQVMQDIVTDEIKLIVDTLDSDKVNVLYVPTGRMPKFKAEQYMKQVAALFKDVKTVETRMVFMTYSSGDTAPVIYKLEEGASYVFQVNTGDIPAHRIKDYMNQQREALNDIFSWDKYDFKVIGVRDAKKITILEQTN